MSAPAVAAAASSWRRGALLLATSSARGRRGRGGGGGGGAPRTRPRNLLAAAALGGTAAATASESASEKGASGEGAPTSDASGSRGRRVLGVPIGPPTGISSAVPGRVLATSSAQASAGRPAGLSGEKSSPLAKEAPNDAPSDPSGGSPTTSSCVPEEPGVLREPTASGDGAGGERVQMRGQDLAPSDDSYPAFTPYHSSLLKKYLTPAVWSRLSRRTTSYGTTIEDVVRAGLALPIGASPPRRVGVLVGDPECYEVFRELLDPIISEYHGVDTDKEYEWMDPELPMEQHFSKKGAEGDAGSSTKSGTSNAPVAPTAEEDDEYGVIKSNGADDDSDENDDSSFLLDEEDDVFVEYIALPSSSALTSPPTLDSQSPPSPRVATIASKRKSHLRRHSTIINNPRLVTNREADPEGKYIVSTRIRLARSLDGLRFPTTMSRSERRMVQRLIGECIDAFQNPGLVDGTYVPVLSMTNEQNLDLIERHILFDNPNEWTVASGMGRDWPDGRALYANVPDLQTQTPDYMIWVNEEDHLRIMCLRTGGDIQGVFTSVMGGVRELEQELGRRGWRFAYDSRLGYLTSCPTNVGTTMRASVHVRLTELGRLPGFFDLVQRLKLEVRGKHGETDRQYTGVFDISNAERLGKSEVHLINVMVEGVAKLIELERRLEAGETVNIDEIAME